MTLGTFKNRNEQKEQFALGGLRDEWAKTYSFLFDQENIRLARSCPNNHFFEWLAPILIYQSTGYYSLMQKYGPYFASHQHKHELAKPILPEGFFDDFHRLHLGEPNTPGTPYPDLLVYAPDYSDWFFW